MRAQIRLSGINYACNCETKTLQGTKRPVCEMFHAVCVLNTQMSFHLSTIYVRSFKPIPGKASKVSAFEVRGLIIVQCIPLYPLELLVVMVIRFAISVYGQFKKKMERGVLF